MDTPIPAEQSQLLQESRMKKAVGEDDGENDHHVAAQRLTINPLHPQKAISTPLNDLPKESRSSPGDLEYVHATSPPDDDVQPSSASSSSLCCLYRIHRIVRRWARRHRAVILKVFLALLLVGYLAYFSYCMHYKFGDEPSVRLLVLTIVIILAVAYKLGKRFLACSPCWSRAMGLFEDSNKRGLMLRKIVRLTFYILAVVGATTIILLEVVMKRPANLISLAGLAFLLITSFFICSKPERINWHPVFWGMMLQFWFAVLILKTESGSVAFKWLADRIVEFLKHTDAGSKSVFGASYMQHRLAFALLPTVIFFNAVISMAYYMGLVQVFIANFGKFLSFCIGTSPIESVNAAANLFLTMAEAPILIKPFLSDITSSELFAVLTGGFASIAGSLLWAFAAFGAPVDHILAASIMSAPAALAFAKLMYPDDRKPTIKAGDAYDVDVSHHGSLLGALANGAKDGLKIAASIAISLIVYTALLEFLDHALLWFTERAGLEGFTFSKLIAYIFSPVTYLMSFPPEDCFTAARLLGIKTLTTTTNAFVELGNVITNSKTLQNYIEIYNATWSYVGDDIFLEATNTTIVGGVMSERAGILATYMICGLSNLGAIGIAIGIYTSIAPTRSLEIMRCVLLALLAGNFASFSTACVAGLLYV